MSCRLSHDELRDAVTLYIKAHPGSRSCEILRHLASLHPGRNHRNFAWVLARRTGNTGKLWETLHNRFYVS